MIVYMLKMILFHFTGMIPSWAGQLAQQSNTSPTDFHKSESVPIKARFLYI